MCTERSHLSRLSLDKCGFQSKVRELLRKSSNALHTHTHLSKKFLFNNFRKLQGSWRSAPKLTVIYALSGSCDSFTMILGAKPAIEATTASPTLFSSIKLIVELISNNNNVDNILQSCRLWCPITVC